MAISKDLTSTKDLSKEDIEYILSEAGTFKEINRQNVKKVDSLKGKTILNLFFEPSTRTRTSFEIAGKRLSADVINISPSTSSTQKGETLLDTIKNIEAMASDVAVIRHPHSGAVKFIADNVKTHIINAGDGANEHPTQSLLDMLTIKTHKHCLEGLNVTIIGDISHSRVARSNIWSMQKFNMNVTLFAPPTMLPCNSEVFNVRFAKDIETAIKDADVIIMLRIQKERMSNLLLPTEREYAKYFALNKQVMQCAKKDVMILHPGPINRGVEMSSVVADSMNSHILNQVENGVAVRMAVLNFLALKNK